MPSSSAARLWGLMAVAAASLIASRASAQQQAQGFAVERFYPSPAGAGWLVMDDLGMGGRLGGAMQLTTGYAMNTLRVSDGAQHLNVVSSQAFVDFGISVVHDRWRVFLNIDAPLAVQGQSGTIGDVQYTAPDLTLGSHPDALADARLGVAARLYGQPDGPLRLGASAELVFPNGARGDYVTDDTFRAMLRALIAGDSGRLSYAGQLGVHIRPLDDAPIPGTARGSELLFGAAAGVRFSPGANRSWALIAGPEVYGASALQALDGSTTALEALLSARIEGTATRGRQLRFKLGAGGGLHPDFGAPEWRLVLAIELFNRDVVAPR